MAAVQESEVRNRREARVLMHRTRLYRARITDMLLRYFPNVISPIIGQYMLPDAGVGGCAETCGIYMARDRMFCRWNSGDTRWRVFHSEECPDAPGSCMFCHVTGGHNSVCIYAEALVSPTGVSLVCPTPEICYRSNRHVCCGQPLGARVLLMYRVTDAQIYRNTWRIPALAGACLGIALANCVITFERSSADFADRTMACGSAIALAGLTVMACAQAAQS